MTRATATGSEGDGSAITETGNRKVAQQEVRVMVVPSPNRQPQGGAAGSESDGSAITETGNRKVAQQEARVMVVPSPKQATARWRSRKR